MGRQAPQSEPPGNHWVGSRSVRGIRSDGPNIRIEKGSGWVFTPGLYGDFILTLEFRILEAGTDAGLFVRADPGEKPTGYRVSLSDSLDDDTAAGPDGFRLVPLQKDTLRGIALPRAGDEWHKLDVSCEGKRLSVKLNGTLIGDLNQISPSVGVIGLAGHRGRLEVRHIDVVHLNQLATAPLSADPERGIFRLMPGNGVTSPKLVKEVKPSYTDGAKARMIQGVVWLEAIVLPEGTVGEYRVTRSLDPELDMEAIATIKKWRFKPGLKNGNPVATIVEIEMSFTLR